MFKFLIVFAFSLFFVGCSSNVSIEDDPIEIEPPKLVIKMEQDSINQPWNFIYEKGNLKDTVFTGKKVNYQFIDTANLDGIGLPEYIVLRDSLIAQGAGIDQRGNWYYHRNCRVLDVWSLDQKKLLFSLVKREAHSYQHSDVLILQEKLYDQKGESKLDNLQFYEYDVEFNFGEIVIKNLRKSENSYLEPDFAEGRYRLKDGVLVLIED